MSNERIITALKDSGMRITKQRRVVADVIAENDGPHVRIFAAMSKRKMIQ